MELTDPSAVDLFDDTAARRRARLLLLREQGGGPPAASPLVPPAENPQEPSTWAKWNGGEGPAEPAGATPDQGDPNAQAQSPAGQGGLPLARQRGLGLLGQLTGDKVLGQVGSDLLQGAHQQEQTEYQQTDHALQRAIQRGQLESQDAWRKSRIEDEKAKQASADDYRKELLKLRAKSQADSAALGRMKLSQQKVATLASGDPKAIAAGIIDGTLSPEIPGNSKFKSAVLSELHAQGFDHARALLEYGAEKRQLASLNGPTQTKLRESIGAAYHSLDTIEGLYDQWKQLASIHGVSAFNKANLQLSAQTGGPDGAVANALLAQIADYTEALGSIYMGGNTPTAEALHLAAQNLKAEWDEPTFRMQVQQIKKGLKVRENSIADLTPAGGSNRYSERGKEKPPEAPAGDRVVTDGTQEALLPAGTPMPAGWRYK